MNDKTKHTLVGLIFGLLTLPLSWAVSLIWAYVITFLAANIVFIGKEIYDKYKPRPTGFDRVDLAADYGGLFAGYCLTFLILGIMQL